MVKCYDVSRMSQLCAYCVHQYILCMMSFGFNSNWTAKSLKKNAVYYICCGMFDLVHKKKIKIFIG